MFGGAMVHAVCSRLEEDIILLPWESVSSLIARLKSENDMMSQALQTRMGQRALFTA